MKNFLGDDFLLETDAAIDLYAKASAMPIIDYHNHLSPKDIALNRKFNNLTEAWLEGDHYKWRAMRSNGVPEEYCTGSVAPLQKFMKWAATVPFTMRNPLYHWTHLELKRYFGIDQLIDERSARTVYENCSAQLQQDDFSVQSMLLKFKVEVLGTTDDPIDSLEYHQQFAKQGIGFRMHPTFRPDKSFGVADPLGYLDYLSRLGAVANVSIKTFDDLLDALKRRVDFFDDNGCRASDHGLESLPFHRDAEKEAPALFDKLLTGKALDGADTVKFRCAVLINLSRMYHSKGWVQQFHLGAQRNNSSRMLRVLGADTGFDSIGEFAQGASMASFFDYLDNKQELTKTIIYNLNPADNALFASMAGNFNDGSVAGKMQFGSGWWFLDQKDGMESQINALSNMGLLSRFVGMVTDSRSFLSFPRHEYFRRVLCNLIGRDVTNGELPAIPRVGEMVEAICYGNAKRFFNF